MLCISRITDDTYSQNFGNNHNKFYIELRCNLPCIPGNDVCSKCIEKSDTCKLQQSRKFNHGKINEPIPDNSHIYGGKWYHNSIKKYGKPSDDVISFAEKYQNDARSHFVVNQIISDNTSTINPKKTRKPKVAPDINNPIKKPRKPKVASESKLTESNQVIIDSTSKSRKKTEITPYTNLINSKTTLVHKEITLPTHIENKMDEIDTDDYNIEYVHLTTFEINGTTYYRDNKKNKLYKKIKDRIGAYIGRYNSENESIITNIPDSDDEE
jgi:hypothetical protein